MHMHVWEPNRRLEEFDKVIAGFSRLDRRQNTVTHRCCGRPRTTGSERERL
jgi:hypothetical protein